MIAFKSAPLAASGETSNDWLGKLHLLVTLGLAESQGGLRGHCAWLPSLRANRILISLALNRSMLIRVLSRCLDMCCNLLLVLWQLGVGSFLLLTIHPLFGDPRHRRFDWHIRLDVLGPNTETSSLL